MPSRFGSIARVKHFVRSWILIFARARMTCRQLIDFLAEYLDGELPETQRHEFDRHLAICDACVAYLQSYKATIALGKAVFECEDEEPPPELPAELLDAILAARAREGSVS